jgi:hypothetical protein
MRWGTGRLLGDGCYERRWRRDARLVMHKGSLKNEKEVLKVDFA